LIEDKHIEAMELLSDSIPKLLNFAKAAKEFIDSHVSDPDQTNEMIEKWANYNKALDDLNVDESEWDLI
jgi:hypothetical protein